MKIDRNNKLLILGVVILLILCYYLAISKTLESRTAYHRLYNESMVFQELPAQVQLLSKKEKQLDSLLKSMNLSNTSFENNLLKTVNLICQENPLKLIDFNNAHIFKSASSQFNTFQFVLEGDFNNTLKGIYSLEQKNNFGEIIHLHFEKLRVNRTRKEALRTTILLQQVE